MSLLVVLKGLPLSYSKDLQEDKEGLFDSFDSLYICIKACIGMISDVTINKEKMLEASKQGHTTATDLADWLVKELKIPFRKSHEISGRIVKLAEKNNCLLNELPLDSFKSIEKKINNNGMAIAFSAPVSRGVGHREHTAHTTAKLLPLMFIRVCLPCRLRFFPLAVPKPSINKPLFSQACQTWS